MASLENVLTPGSADLPDCKCGAEMKVFSRTAAGTAGDAEIRVYRCSSCQHELRLTVWELGLERDPRSEVIG